MGDDGRRLGEWGIVYHIAFHGAHQGCMQRAQRYLPCTRRLFQPAEIGGMAMYFFLVWEAKISAIQQGLSYYLHYQVVALWHWPTFSNLMLLHSQST